MPRVSSQLLTHGYPAVSSACLPVEGMNTLFYYESFPDFVNQEEEHILSGPHLSTQKSSIAWGPLFWSFAITVSGKYFGLLGELQF